MIDSNDMNDLQLEDVEDYVADYPANGSNFPEQNLHSPSESLGSTGYRRNKLTTLLRANKWFVAVVATVVVVMMVIVGLISGASNAAGASSNSGDTVSSDNGIWDPIKIDPSTLDPAVTGPLLESLLNTYDRHGIDSTPLQDGAGNTPQRLAFYWLATDENLNDLGHTEKIQRFALAVFYYSTNKVATSYEKDPKPWVSAHLWLSTAHVCEWKGVVCNSQQHIEAIDLERNNLTGALPHELALLAEHLVTLDLTSNMIYMEGDHFDIFAPLTNLETLLMDDNFLVTDNGLPWQFKKLEKMAKMRLSYNLMAGQMEKDHKVLGHLSKLTHLEIESNFLTGTIPDAIATMSNLVYLYVRRNELSFNLDFLKQGKLTNLFAIWLDNNKVTGTIPSEIGLMTELASVSITNSTLSGTIPTEVGKLSKLRRLWLYKNELTGDIPTELANLNLLEVFEVHNNKIVGSMPDAICKSIESSTYQYKSLTSDCKSQVVCPENTCCTECFN